MINNDDVNAFPREDYQTDLQQGQSGMTLRDYFAAKAMQGELAAQSEESGFYDSFEILAKKSYELADAMLQARKS